MKKAIALIMIVLLVVELGACAAPAPAAPAPAPAPGAAPAAPAPTPTPSPHANWPTGPITIIVNFGPGGGTDLTTRTLAGEMERILGVPIIVDNVTGGDGSVGLSRVMTSQPDGYTFGTGTGSNLTILPQMVDVPYDPWNDFVWVGSHGEFPYGLWSPTARGFETLDDFLNYARANPGALTFGGSGVILLLLVEQLAMALGESFDWVYMPTSSAAETVMGMQRGDLDFAAEALGTVRPVQDEFNLLVSLSAERLPGFPDIPSVVELGITDVPIRNFLGLLAPAGLPDEIRDKMEDTMRQAMENPEVLENMRRTMEYVPFLTGQQFFDASYAVSLQVAEVLALGITR